MLKEHQVLAVNSGIPQNAGESEYNFRKRVFVEIYPKDALQAIEIFFCVTHYSNLQERDLIFIAMARDLFDEKDEEGLWKFVNGFSTDPSKTYCGT